MRKHILFIIITLATITATGQNEIRFTYDESGNRISRSDVPVENLFEQGLIEMTQADAWEWTTVYLGNTYQNPVVIMGPFSYDGGDPSTVRVKDVTSTSFKFQLDEWDYADGPHTSEVIGYLVVESGLHSFGDLMWQAGTIDQVNTSFQSVHFPRNFESMPVVLTQVSTVNEASAVVTRTQNVGFTAFEVKLHEEEANDGDHASEEVGYLAIEQGTGQAGNYSLEVGTTGSVVNHNWYTINFSSSITSPVFLADLQTANLSVDDLLNGIENDPATLRHKELTSTSVKVFVEEERSADDETSHNGENVGYLVIENNGGIQQKSAVYHSPGDLPQDTTHAETEESAPAKAIHLYPNPTRGHIKVELQGYPMLNGSYIQVFSLDGKLLQRMEKLEPTNEVDLSAQPAGTYLIRVVTGEKSQEWKVVKE